MKTSPPQPTNWRTVVEANHQWAHQDDGYELVTGHPATAEEINTVGTDLGFEFPAEFRELFQTFDGIGIRDEEGEILWTFTPLSELPTFIEKAREWFRGTHPQATTRFFPFIDWFCGDYTGYHFDRNGELPTQLFCFNHEDYDFDEAQDEREFLASNYRSIADFLATD